MNSKMKTMFFYQTVPITMFRVQMNLPVSLQSFQAQNALGRSSFDLNLREDGLVHPVPRNTPFRVQNGLSLFPRGRKLGNILNNHEGKPPIYRLQEGLDLPDSFVIVHEHTDHYSLQTSRPIALSELNADLTAFLKTLPVSSYDDFVAWINDEDDQDG